MRQALFVGAWGVNLLLGVIFFVQGCASKSGPGAGSALAVSPAGKPAKYGQLQVVGQQLCDSAGRPVQLRGMSTMGLQWYGEIINDAAFAALAQDWHADVVRLVLYVGDGGYASHPELKQLVFKGVELAVRYGMYAIIDWHVLKPGDPNDAVYAGAQGFFDEVSKKYSGVPNVMYEIMNEPNGPISWTEHLKPYAERMVATIRANDAKNIILIGSGSWSQDVDIAAASPVNGTNLMYTFHFYAGSHGQALRDKVEAALSHGVAVFCSEWGTSEASGTGGPYLRAADEWLRFLDSRGISWTNWSLCDKSESSAAFQRGQGDDRETVLVPELPGPAGFAVWKSEDLSASGAFVREALRVRSPGAVSAGRGAP